MIELVIILIIAIILVLLIMTMMPEDDDDTKESPTYTYDEERLKLIGNLLWAVTKVNIDKRSYFDNEYFYQKVREDKITPMLNNATRAEVIEAAYRLYEQGLIEQRPTYWGYVWVLPERVKHNDE